MAANEYGGSDRFTPEQRRKLKRRTTASSRARLRERFREGDRQNGSGGGGEPSRPKPPGPLQRRADQLTDLRYAPVDQSLQQRGLAIPNWFENYRAQIGQQQAASQQYAAPIVQQAQQSAQQAGQVAPGVDPNSEAGKDAVLAAAARQSLGDAFATMLQGFGQVQNNYMEGRKTVASTAELGEQSQLARDRSDTAREKGLYRATTLEELGDKRHTQRLENAAFGLEQYEAATEQQDKRRERRREGGEVNEYGYTDREWRGLSQPERTKIIRSFKKKPGSGGGENEFTATQRSDTKKSVRQGINLVLGKLRGKQHAPTDFWRQALDALINEKDYDPVIARAIIQIVRDGKAKPGTMRTIRRDYGVGQLPRRKPFRLPDPYVLPDRPAPESGERPLTSP